MGSSITPAAGVGLCAIAVVGLLLCEWRSLRLGIWVSKPLASVGYLIAAWQLGVHSDYAQWLFAALVACFAGDLLLIPEDERYFKAGVVAFAVGHLLFGCAFWRLGLRLSVALPAWAVLMVVGHFVWGWLRPHMPPGMGTAIRGYIVVIAGMVACAYGAAAGAGIPMLAAAATLFFVSDLAVARDAFVSRAFINRAVGLPLYYAAQLAFVLTAMLVPATA